MSPSRGICSFAWLSGARHGVNFMSSRPKSCEGTGHITVCHLLRVHSFCVACVWCIRLQHILLALRRGMVVWGERGRGEGSDCSASPPGSGRENLGIPRLISNFVDSTVLLGEDEQLFFFFFQKKLSCACCLGGGRGRGVRTCDERYIGSFFASSVLDESVADSRCHQLYRDAIRNDRTA